MNEFKAWYKSEVDIDDVFGSGVCPSCLEKGYHLICQTNIEVIRNAFEETDRALLDKYSINGCYGISDDRSKEFDTICMVLSKRLEQELNFDIEKIIENIKWWFIPHGGIGVMGFLVEKDTKDIFSIGSRARLELNARAYWHGIEWYTAGHGEKLDKKT